MQKTKMALIGMGYLGTPLAQALIKQGFPVTATKTTNKTSQPFTHDLSLLPFDITQLTNQDNLPAEIQNADILIYNIPPIQPQYVEIFFRKLNANQKIIYTSSTSVYGKNMGSIDENTPIPSPSINAPIVLELEFLAKKYFKHLALLRFGGLYGNTPFQKRHPVTFLAGKKELKTGHEYLHLVHVYDCIKAIVKVIEKDLFPIELNIISDLRILKKDYYTEMVQKLHLDLPMYDDNPVHNATQISNHKSIKLLGMTYRNPIDYFIEDDERTHQNF